MNRKDAEAAFRAAVKGLEKAKIDLAEAVQRELWSHGEPPTDYALRRRLKQLYPEQVWGKDVFRALYQRRKAGLRGGGVRDITRFAR